MYSMIILRRLRTVITASYSYTKNIRLLHFYHKNINYFRNRNEYKNLVIPLTEDLSKENHFKEQEILTHFMQRENVMKMTTLQLKDFLCLLANMDVDTSKYALVLKFLDEKCALSAERLPLDLSFYILDAWSLIWGPKTFKKHYYSAITSQWSKKIRKCTKLNLVLMLHFIGMSKLPSPFLMDSAIDKIEDILSEFSDEEVAIICLSFFKCSKKITSPSFLQQACKACERLLLKRDHFNAISVLKCLRLSRYYDGDLWDAVRVSAIDAHANLNLVECTNFLALFASENCYDAELYEMLEGRVLDVLREEMKIGAAKESFTTHPSLRSRVKDIARFIWALTTVGHTVREETLECLNDFVEARLKLGEYETQSPVLVDTLQSFVLANNYSESLFSLALNSTIAKRTYKGDKSKPKYQLHFVEKSVSIEHPEIPIYSMNITHSIPKNLERDTSERKGFKELILFLEAHYPNSFKSCYIIPHIMIAGIIFVKDRETPSAAWSTYQKCVSNGIISKQVQGMFKSNRDYFCIEILDSSVCAKGSDHPLGLIRTKIRQLEKLNFKVIALSSDDIAYITENKITKDCNIEDIFSLKLI